MSSFNRLNEKLVVAALATIGAGCAPAEPAGAPTAIPEIAGRTAGAPQTCVSLDPNASLRMIDSRTVLYTSGSTVWLNRLASECPGRTSMDILVTEPTGSQYCRGDRVRSVDPASNIPGPVCVLGDFIPYRR